MAARRGLAGCGIGSSKVGGMDDWVGSEGVWLPTRAVQAPSDAGHLGRPFCHFLVGCAGLPVYDAVVDDGSLAGVRR